MANYDAIALRPFGAFPITATRAPIRVSEDSLQDYELLSTSEEALGASSLELGGVTPVVTYYQMRGVDIDCVLILTYRSWVVAGSPDFTGALYTGPKCGPTPLSSIVVVDSWSE